MKRPYDGAMTVAWAAGWGVRNETLLENCNKNKIIAGVTSPCALCVAHAAVLENTHDDTLPCCGV